MDLMIVYTRPDGGVSVMCPLEPERKRHESDEDFAARVRDKDVPADATNIRFVPRSQFPADKVFRAAWKNNAAGVEVDMPIARTIHLDRIRRGWPDRPELKSRDQKLAELDRESLMADERGDPQGRAAIIQQKQALRDLPDNVNLDQFTSPESLAAFWPSELS